jgi:hypothetical protein
MGRTEIEIVDQCITISVRGFTKLFQIKELPLEGQLHRKGNIYSYIYIYIYTQEK